MDKPLVAVRYNVLRYKPLVFGPGIPEIFVLELFGRRRVLPVNNAILPWATHTKGVKTLSVPSWVPKSTYIRGPNRIL